MWILSIDPGPATTTHATLIGIWPKRRYWVVDEYRWDAKETGVQLNYDDHVGNIVAMLGDREPSIVYYDPEDKVMGYECQRVWGKRIVKEAYKPGGSVRDGAGMVNWLLGNGDLMISPEAGHSLGDREVLLG